MSDAKPNGKLTTGAIGGFMLGAAFILMTVMGGGIGAMGGQAAGGMALLGGLLILAGGICQALGWFGLGGFIGGSNKIAGIFSIITVVGLLLMILGGIMTSMMFVSLGMHAFFLGLCFTGILGGLGLMAGKNEGGMFNIAGILLIVGGAAMLLIYIQLPQLAGQFLPLGLMNIMGWVVAAGLGVGHILAGVSMMGARD